MIYLTSLYSFLKASESAAFGPASIYFKAGYELCGWDEDPTTMQKLCSEGACSCFINNDFEQMNVFVNEVLSKDFIPITQKNKCYEVKIKAALAKGNVIDSMDIALQYHRALRNKVGFPAIRNQPVPTLSIITDYIKTTRMLKKLTQEDIVSLPDITDEHIVIGQRNLRNLTTSVYAVQPTLMPVIIMLTTRTSIKHGIDASSCDSFAMFGMVLCAFGKMQRGREMGKASQMIVEKYQAKEMKSRVTFLCEFLIYHWSSPLQGTLAPLLEGYHSGLESGDTESAIFNLSARAQHMFYSGRPLENLEQELMTCIEVCEQLDNVLFKMVLMPFLLAVRKLRGDDVLEEGMDFHAIEKSAKDTNNNSLLATVMIAQMSLHVVFQEWRAASNILVNAGDACNSMTGQFSMVRFKLLEALISLKVAQSATSWSMKRKWKSKGLKAMKLVKGWLKKGPNPNIVHFMHLLEAENAVLRGKKAKAEGDFKRSITVAAQNGFLQVRMNIFSELFEYHA